MIDFAHFKKKVDEYYSMIENKVMGTKELDSMPFFFMEKLKSQKSYRDLSSLEIYLEEYKRISKITREHIQRGVSDIEDVYRNLGLGTEYILLAKITHELHDIARVLQFVKTGTTVDGDSYDREFIRKRNLTLDLPDEVVNHASHGAYILKNGLFDFLDIDSQYREIIENAVKYHSTNRLPSDLGKRVSESLFDGKDISEAIIDDNYYPDVVRIYTQTVKSVDNFDLNNKILLGAIPLVRERFKLYVYQGDRIEDFAKRWGVSDKVLRDYNRLSNSEELKEGDIIFIPSSYVPTEKMIIPQDYIEMLKNDTFPEKVSALQRRRDYTFLTAQVWRLSLFRNIEFKSLLKIVEDKKILDQIFNLYPDQYKELMEDVFTYTKNDIIKPGLQNKESKIYALKRSSK